ncbi:hypothetical protein D6D17_10546 [Aureobasidium pullulans]|nr:hypothetical protein D6D17_10546 [Aureobasidium pullulans]
MALHFFKRVGISQSPTFASPTTHIRTFALSQTYFGRSLDPIIKRQQMDRYNERRRNRRRTDPEYAAKELKGYRERPPHENWGFRNRELALEAKRGKNDKTNPNSSATSEWKIIKEGEDDYGELIRMIAETSRNVLTWWIMSLRKRVQVGFISSDLSFVEILIRERANLASNGILGAIRYLTVGGFSEVVSQLMLTFADWYLGEYVLELSKKVIRLKASTRKRFMLLRCVNYGYKTLNALVHLSVYSLSQLLSP